MNQPTARFERIAALGLVLGLGSLVAACGGDAAQRTEAHYCTVVGEHLVDLSAPTISAPGDVKRVLKSWKAVSATAPLAVQPEWEAVIHSMETAATVDPNDPESVQKVADTARSSEQAANRVINYTMERCGAQIGTPAAAP